MRSVRFDEARWAAQLRETTVEEIAQAMLPAAPVNPVGPAPDRLAIVRQLALDPAYQLK